MYALYMLPPRAKASLQDLENSMSHDMFYMAAVESIGRQQAIPSVPELSRSHKWLSSQPFAVQWKGQDNSPTLNDCRGCFLLRLDPERSRQGSLKRPIDCFKDVRKLRHSRK